MKNGRITLEDHFALPDTLGDSQRYAAPENWAALEKCLVDIHDARLAEMDRHGIEMMVLSLNAPGIQAIPDPRRAIDLSRRSNDYLAETVAKAPHRFAAFAALPMQDAEAATSELTRCVRTMGFHGALVNGFSEVGTETTAVYSDLPQYEPFWQTAETLNVPIYLHPREPLLSRQQHYEGHPWFLGSAWAFAVETSIHALRLMGSGLFDRYPKLKVILGHLGEGLPYNIWRVDHRLSRTPRGIPARKTMSEYLRENFYLTTSGNFRTQTLIAAMSEVGADRILFSVDYPFEQIGEAVEWLNGASISEPDRAKIGRTNAQQLLGLNSL